ncbi:MAG: SPOR domain-containing protein [Paludibacteraceae bacterium]|nr:SPOR domain-containing protein [Paludibacteraceae bacterium]
MKRFCVKLLGPLCLSLIIFNGCSNDKKKEVEVFSENKPYTLEILKDRSYYQADKVVNRLGKKGVDSYILKSLDEEGDDWYSVVSGAFESDSAMNAFKMYLDTAMHIKAGEAVNFTSLDSVGRIPVKIAAVKESKRIDANKPDVPKDIEAIIKRYPGNDIFYLKNISLVSLTKEGISSTQGKHVDMPRGITLEKLRKKEFTAFGSVIYKDNLYKDEVTLQIAKYKEHVHQCEASFVPSSNPVRDEVIEICSLFADLVLETGKYEEEQKQEVELDGGDLVGYKASFRQKKNGYRAYYFLTDQWGDYVYMLQSTKQDDSELMQFISDLGNSEGLDNYDEFYNSFYTIADEMMAKDEFVGYYVDRLDYTYAKERGYVKWANRMVGHWYTNVYFNNTNKGVWMYSIFDLLTDEKSSHVYKKLYRNDQAKESERRIYGETGTALYKVRLNEYWDVVKSLEEISFSRGRYIIASTGSYRYSETDLTKRCESLQFQRGGYDEPSKSKNDDGDSENTTSI